MAFGREASDGELLEGFRKGNSGNFETLLRRYEKPLFGFLYRKTGDAQEAEDLFQETWARVYRSVRKFQAGARFSPWLYQIAYRLSVDSHRRRRREEVEIPDGEGKEIQPDIQDLAADREVNRRVRALVDVLDEDLRTVVILRHYQGLRYEEIAEVLTCPVGTVKSKMHRAISVLKKQALRNGLIGGRES